MNKQKPMTKRLTIALFLLIAYKSHGQDKNRLLFFLGGGSAEMLGDGISNKNFSPKDPVIYRQITKITFSFGLGLDHKFSDHFSLTGRLLSEGKGGTGYQDSYSYDFFSNTYTYLNSVRSDISVTYVTLAAIPQYTFKNFNIGIGGYVGTPYKAITKNEYINYTPPQAPSHFNSISIFKNIDAGVVFNIGYTIPLNDYSITFQASDSYGLKNVLVSTQVPAVNLHNYSLLIGFSYSKIGRKYLNKPKP